MATIRKKKPGQWHAQVRKQGWPPQTDTFPTKKQAQDWARHIEVQMSAGRFVDRTLGQRTTLNDLIKLYLKEVTAKRPGEQSRVAECSRLDRFMREEKALCSYAATNLTPEHFEDYRDRRLRQSTGNNKTLAPATIKRELTLLKRVIDYRKRRLGLAINPVNTEDVVRPVVNDERDVRLNKDEMTRLLRACTAAQNKWLYPLVAFAFETGGRRSSLLGLKWNDVSLKKRTAIFRAVKNSRNPDKVIDHTVALSPRAVKVLASLPRDPDGKVFSVSANAFRLAFNRARKKAGVEHFRFHDIRHERVSSLVEAGWSDTAVMALSGHKDPKSLKRYANIRPDHLADELAKLDRR